MLTLIDELVTISRLNVPERKRNPCDPKKSKKLQKKKILKKNKLDRQSWAANHRMAPIKILPVCSETCLSTQAASVSTYRGATTTQTAVFEEA